jgi:cytochrome c oxidase assembly factor CtaG
MVQHIILILVAAPLLVLGATPAALIWAVPRRWQRGLGRWWQRQRTLQAGWRILTQPLLVWTLHTIALWAWHAPGLYQAALQSETLHALEHLSFLSTGLLFWWTVVAPYRGKKLAAGPGRLLSVFTMALQSGGLGALITFSPRPWYGAYTSTTTPWNLTPLEDQQLAGVIMWVPAGVVYLVAALVLLGLWLQALERQDRRNESRWKIASSSRPAAGQMSGQDAPVL